MKWADLALRLLLRARDREAISGDLLEEYREVVLPARGARAARLWYARQVLSFVSPLAWGVAIGLACGVLLLADTAIEPLADDESAAVALAAVGVLALSWIATSWAAASRTDRFRDAVRAGALVGAMTIAVFHLLSIVRVSVFLDQIRFREDWVNLVGRFQASGFQSLRTYAVYEYVRQTPLLLALASVAGAACGLIAGAINALVRRPASGS